MNIIFALIDRITAENPQKEKRAPSFRRSFFNRVRVGSRWRFKNSSQKLIVKVFDIETCYDGKKKYHSVLYGITGSVAGHMSQSIVGFLENYELLK